MASVLLTFKPACENAKRSGQYKKGSGVGAPLEEAPADAVEHRPQAASREIARPIIYYGRAAGCWQPQIKQLAVRGCVVER
jgi:hypothetical protein